MMIYDYKIILGAISVVVGLIGYVPYFRDIYRGTTKPHPFSWFLWGLLDGVVFVAQIVRDGGAGAWVTGMTTIACFVIAGIALSRGEKRISALDWWCLATGLSGIILWVLTRDPFYAVVLVTITDMIAFVPTFRKAYLRPGEETVSTYVLSATKWIIGIAALQTLSATTWLYPASLVIMNNLFAFMVVVRRRQLARVDS